MAPKAAAQPCGNPPDGIESRSVASLKPYAKNARTHSDEQVEQLVASIEEFGFTIPILVDEKGMVLAGHGRLLAAEKRGMSHVPVMVARGWRAEKKRAYIIADNRLAENAGWNKLLLGNELGNLALAGVNLDVLGFAPGEIAALIAMAHKPLADADAAPEVPETPLTQLGDVWVMGEHRLLCGDATSKADVARVLAGAKPHLMVTDPPYGVDYDPGWRGKALNDGANRAIGKVSNDGRADWREAWALFPGNVLYVWHSGKHCTEVGASLKTQGFEIRSQIVWVKGHPVLGMIKANYNWQHEALFYAQRVGSEDDHWRFEDEHELAVYAVRLGSTADWRGGRKQSTVWNIDVVQNDTGHGTQKPVECMRRPIANNSKGGDRVYDPFLGSGTTLIAAHELGRVCLGLELDPGYCDVIVQRWQAFSGGVAIHEATGKTISELRAIRNGDEARTETGRSVGREAGIRDRGKTNRPT